jgi:hypothetical protein
MKILARRRAVITSLVAASALATMAVSAGTVGASANSGAPMSKSQMGNAPADKKAGPVTYRGGKVLLNSTTYAIFWGPSSGFPSDLVTGMQNLLSGFSGSTYLATANQYVGGTATTDFVTSLFDASAPPKTGPNTNAIVSEVARVLGANGIAPDTNAIYLVYTSNLPKVNYCAWHSSGTIGTTTVQVAYLPNTAGTTACFPTTGTFGGVTPYSYGTRSIADNTAHEFMESVTDPVPPTGWLDANGAEIGDKCDFDYISPVTLSGKKNVWQIQAEWSNAAGGCVQTTP